MITTTQPIRPSGEQKRLLHIMWFGMVIIIGAYWVAHAFLSRSPKSPMLSFNIGIILLAVSLLCTLVALGWNNKTVAWVTHQVGPTVFMRLGAEDRIKSQNKIQRSYIGILALLEVGPLLGLVSTFLGSEFDNIFEITTGSSLFILILIRLRGYPRILDALSKLEIRDIES